MQTEKFCDSTFITITIFIYKVLALVINNMLVKKDL